MNERVHIFVVAFNSPELEIPCVASVIRNTNHPYILEVYNNYPENAGLSSLWNQVMSRTPCKYVCFLNSDTEVTEGWLDKLVEVYSILEDSPRNLKISGVGPVTNKCATKQRGRKGPGPFQIKELPELSGFCFIVSKWAFAAVGSFDEEFTFYGGESDWFRRARRLGLKAYYREDVFVKHVWGGTAKKDPRRWKKLRREGITLFKAKE